MRAAISRIVVWRGRPGAVTSDNGTELTSNAILKWADERGAGWQYIRRLGKGPMFAKVGRSARYMMRSLDELTRDRIVRNSAEGRIHDVRC